MPATDAFEGVIADGILGDPNWAPGAFSVGLSTTTPTNAGGNFTEPVGGSYAQVATVDADWAAFGGTAPVTKANANAITFPTATGSWGTVTHFGLFEGATLRMWGALGTSKLISSGDTASFAAGALIVKVGQSGDTF
jgi:hypothetical protein